MAFLPKTLTPWKKNYAQPRQHIKKQRHCFANKGPSRQGYGFSSGHVWMCALEKEMATHSSVKSVEVRPSLHSTGSTPKQSSFDTTEKLKLSLSMLPERAREQMVVREDS